MSDTGLSGEGEATRLVRRGAVAAASSYCEMPEAAQLADAGGLNTG